MIGDYKPRYIYGTVKIHKLSTPTNNFTGNNTYIPTYKTINDLITLYLSHNYSIKSTKELIEILKSHKPNKGILISLDGKFIHKCSSFRNNRYNYEYLPPSNPPSTQNQLRKILLFYTTKVSFYVPPWKYVYPMAWNSDGVSFGKPFLVSFTCQP